MADLAVVLGQSGPFRVIFVGDPNNSGGGVPVTISWIPPESQAFNGDPQFAVTGIYTVQKAKMVYDALQLGVNRDRLGEPERAADYYQAQEALQEVAMVLGMDAQREVDGGDMSF